MIEIEALLGTCMMLALVGLVAGLCYAASESIKGLRQHNIDKEYNEGYHDGWLDREDAIDPYISSEVNRRIKMAIESVKTKKESTDEEWNAIELALGIKED